MSAYRFLLAAPVLFAAALFGQNPPAEPAAAREAGLYVTVETTAGPIVAKLYESEAPMTVKNFVDLALGRKPWRHPVTGETEKKPLYNGTFFHRTIAGFMIQGGDPSGDGTGNTEPIEDEIHASLKFDQPGRLAMANLGQPNTASCQFFITEVATPHLDGSYTIFGQVVEGMDVVKKIANAPKRPGNDEQPVMAEMIQKVSFKREGAAPENDPLGK